MIKQRTTYGTMLVVLLLFLPAVVFAMDSDNDGLSDELEAYYMTDPHQPDTDGDGYLDGVEVKHDYSPHMGLGTRLNEFDYDGDGLNDWLERWFGSHIGAPDSDSNGESDYEAVMRAKDPKGSNKTFIRDVVVDRSLQRLYYYVDGVKIQNWPVSTGNPGTPTPDGEFTIERMIDSKSYIGPGYNIPGVKWNMQFKPMYYIHSAYWHNDFGRRTHSHGCVNMLEGDAAELYKYMDVGVPVRIIGETPKNYLVGS